MNDDHRFIELVLYDEEDIDLEDQERVEHDPVNRRHLARWRGLPAEAPAVLGTAARAKRLSTAVSLSVYQVGFTWTSSPRKTCTVCVTLDDSSL